MALSTCPKCNNRFFELKLVEPRGSRYKQNFVQCTGCGAPAGAVGYYDEGSLLKEQEEALAEISKRLKTVEAVVATIDHNIRVLAKSLR